MEIIFDKIDRFFDRIKRMNVVKFFLLTWVIHFSWTLVAGITLALSGAKFSQHDGRLTKERYFLVEKYCLLCLTLISSIIFGWVHGNVFNVLLQGVSGMIFYIIYLRCFFIERDLGVRDRWQIVPLAESSAYHAIANAFLIFI